MLVINMNIFRFKKHQTVSESPVVLSFSAVVFHQFIIPGPVSHMLSDMGKKKGGQCLNLLKLGDLKY